MRVVWQVVYLSLFAKPLELPGQIPGISGLPSLVVVIIPAVVQPYSGMPIPVVELPVSNPVGQKPSIGHSKEISINTTE
jgi:hypothetical protein